MKPRPWWEEYLGLKIRFEPLKLHPKRVWQTTGAYVAWIVPGALVSLLASLGFGVQAKQVPIQARPKEVHIPSQSQHTDTMLTASNELEAVAVTANPFPVGRGFIYYGPALRRPVVSADEARVTTPLPLAESAKADPTPPSAKS